MLLPEQVTAIIYFWEIYSFANLDIVWPLKLLFWLECSCPLVFADAYVPVQFLVQNEAKYLSTGKVYLKYTFECDFVSVF